MGSSFKSNGSDCLLDINGHCFLCLNRIASGGQGASKTKPVAKTKVKVTPGVNSIQCLARCLKLDKRKRFGEGGGGDPHLVSKLEEGRLLVELCGDCAKLNRIFSEVYEQMERIQLEVDVQLNMVHEKLMEAEIHQTGRLREFTLNQATMGRGLRGKLEKVRALRKEIIEKSSRKLSSVQPRQIIDDLDQDPYSNSGYHSDSSEGELLIDVDESKIAILNELSDEEVGSGHPEVEEDPELSSFLEILECDDDNDQNQEGGGKEEDDANQLRMTFHADADGDDATANQEEDFEIEIDMDAHHPKPNGLKMKTLYRNEPLVISPFQSLASPDSEELQNYTVDPATARLRCNVCSKEFKNIGTFVPHYRGTHLQVRYECEVCHKRFRRHDNYTIHYRNFHMGLRFPCNFQSCDETFTRKTLLKKHVETVHMGLKLQDMNGMGYPQLPVGGTRSSTQDDPLKMEVEDEDEDQEPFILPAVEYEDDYEEEGETEEQKLSHNEMTMASAFSIVVPVGAPLKGPPKLTMKPNPFPHSSKSMPSLTPLNGQQAPAPTPAPAMEEDYNIYNTDDPGWANIPPPIASKPECGFNHQTRQYSCSYCDLEFETMDGFNNHATQAHQELRFKCTQCNRDFSGHGAYRVHYRSFHLGVRHVCGVCHKTFSQNSHLKYHQRTSCVAIGVRVHTHYCGTCGKGFYEAKSLRVHTKRVHNKIKEHGCTLCGKAFYLKCQLIRHQEKDHVGAIN